ncbi:MAG TPA: TonB-dependent receptor plug domain-containing protein, partial [Prolixibacteraceae bacterium]|nr:TonB-dependent receptor plug domain-containing protein [Prolixibacteraceae bacterium]
MKLTIMLVLIGVIQLSASVYSQTTNLSLDLKNKTVKEVLQSIEDHSDFRFFYNEKFVDLSRIVSVTSENKSVENILSEIFKNTNISYKVMGNKLIIITPVEDNMNTQQTKSITGKVTDSTGNSLPGVSIVVKGTTIGMVTDVNGKYSLSNVPADATLIFSFVGMKAQEVKPGNQSIVDVVMKEESIGINEVVVTALGISREKKGLGYAVQEIKGDQLNVARETNFVNSLAGKVAGVNIVSGGAVGSSSRITMRGESSLSLQSNQPLFVVDGVPMGNDGVSNTTAADYGNSSSEVNPADIESMTVLKGPAASALYGSRAANGAIVIVTKSGKQGKGIGVSVNSGTTFESLLRLPKFQNKFGQGNNGLFEGSNFGNSSSGYPNGVNDNYDESWGPRLDVGTMKKQFFSPTTGGMRGGDVDNPNRGDIIATPWVSRPNNIRDFFELGHTYYNNIALTGSNEKGDFRISYTNLDEKGV